MLRAALVLVFLAPYTFLASLIGYPLARLQRSPQILYALGRFAVRVALLMAGTRVVLESAERLGDTRNTVLMPNHLSNLDAPVLLQALGVDFKAVAKKEVFGVPFFSRCLRYAGFIEVDRSDKAQSTAAISRAVESLKGGSCFLIFPEGTRSRTGELGEFKKGAFIVALEAGSRIVPVAVLGTGELMPRGRLRLRPGRVLVKVLDPVDAWRYSYEARDLLIAEVRGRIAAALASHGDRPRGGRSALGCP